MMGVEVVENQKGSVEEMIARLGGCPEAAHDVT